MRVGVVFKYFKVNSKAKVKPLTQIGNILSLVALGRNRLVRLFIFYFFIYFYI